MLSTHKSLVRITHMRYFSSNFSYFNSIQIAISTSLLPMPRSFWSNSFNQIKSAKGKIDTFLTFWLSDWLVTLLLLGHKYSHQQQASLNPTGKENSHFQKSLWKQSIKSKRCRKDVNNQYYLFLQKIVGCCRDLLVFVRTHTSRGQNTVGICQLSGICR